MSPNSYSDIAAGEDGVAWTAGGDRQVVYYLADGSDKPAKVATVVDDGSVSELLVSGKSVYWVVEIMEPVPAYELFTWHPGDHRPRRLASSHGPAHITDLQVVGTRVLFSSGSDGRDAAGKTEDDADYNAGSDSSHGWRMLDIARPSQAKRLDFGPAGAEAVLGDGFLAWIEPVGDWRVRHRSVGRGLRLGAVHSVANPQVEVAGVVPEALLLQASGDRLAWRVRTDLDAGNDDRIASWRLGDSRAALVPGSADVSEYALSRSLVAWVDEMRTGVFTWRPGDIERSVVSTAPGGWGVSVRGDSVLYASLRDGRISLSRWDGGSDRSELIWGTAAVVDEQDYAVYAHESQRRIIFSASYSPTLEALEADEDDTVGELGTMLATRR